MVPARVVLYMLSFSGFLVSFMMRTDINIAIVAMVKMSPLSSTDNNVTVTTHCYSTTNVSLAVENSSALRPEEMGEFEWSPGIQAAILGSFYWCYILSQVVGGVLTQYFGTKTVFGGSQLVTAICSLLMPSAADLHYGAMITLRSIQGIASGLTWPAMYAIVGHWIPPVERSRFMSSFQEFVTLSRRLTNEECTGCTSLRPFNKHHVSASPGSWGELTPNIQIIYIQGSASALG